MTGAEALDSPAFKAVVDKIQHVVERRPDSWFWRRWQIRRTEATGVLFTGTHHQCLRVEQALNLASRDSAWVALIPEYH